MRICELDAAKKTLPGQKKRLCSLSVTASAYPQKLCRYLYLLITVKGHAWAMDVKSERTKMAKLISQAIQELPGG